MKMCVIGGGNIGTLMAAELAAKGHEVTIYSSKPQLFAGEITVFDQEENMICKGVMANITHDLSKAVMGAEYIWITLPSWMFAAISKQLEPYIVPDQKIGIIPGSGGAEFAFSNIIKKGAVLFGFQRVHSIARLKEYGKSVYMLGRKEELQIAAIPKNQTSVIAKDIALFFEMKTVELPNYLSVTLTPSNPILHTSRLYSMFKNYNQGVVYSRDTLFYEEWDDAASHELFLCDEELQKLCAIIPLELTTVKSLLEHYESYTEEAMTAKIKSIKAFKGMLTPMIKKDNGYIPDFNSRYFTADFAFGLKIIKDIASIFAVDTTNIDKMWLWFKKIADREQIPYFDLKMSQKEFLDLYL